MPGKTSTTTGTEAEATYEGPDRRKRKKPVCSNDVLAEKIENVRRIVATDSSAISTLSSAFQDMQLKVTEFIVSTQGTLKLHETTFSNYKTEHARDHDDLDIRITKVENELKEINKLVPAIRAIIWVAGILGVSIIALIWALITGQVTLNFA